MKKFLILVLCLLMVIPTLAMAQEQQVVNVLSWEGYVDADTLYYFEEETGIKVVWSPIESNEDALLKITQGGGEGYDLVLVSDYILDILRKQDLLQTLDMSLIPNYENLDDAYLSKFYDENNEYVMPYVAGSPLIVYDQEAIGFEITGYADLWNESLVNNIAVMDSARVICGMTLKTMGKSFNETDEEVLAEMKEVLLPLYQNIRTFGDMEAYSAIVTGEVDVAFMYTPFVSFALMDRPELTVVYPQEGLGYGIDGFALCAQSPNAENAHAFLNYLLDAEVAAHNAEWQAYMCVNEAATDYLSAQYAENPAMNLPEDMLAEAEFVEDVGDLETLYQEIYTAFKLQ